MSPRPLSRLDFLRLAGVTAGVAGAAVGRAAPATAGSAPATTRIAHPAATGGPIMSGDRFPIGLYWPPPPYQTTLARYREIVAAGFTFSHSNNYLFADSLIQQRALGFADQVGLQVLVDDPDIRWLVGRFRIGGSGEFTLTEREARSVVKRVVDTYRPHSYWSVVDGQLLIDGGAGDGSVGLSTVGDDWTDYTFQVTLTPRQTGGQNAYAQAGLVFRARDAGHGYAWLLGNTGPGQAPGYLTRVVMVEGALQSVTTVPLRIAITPERAYRVAIRVVGDTIETTVDGQRIDRVVDATHAAGRVGFREAGTESALFDQLTVTDAAGKVRLREDFAAGLATWQPPAPVPGFTSFAGLDIYDEPVDSALPVVGDVVGLVKAIDPGLLPFVNFLPNFDGGTGYARAAATVRPLQLSFDRYPILPAGEDTGYFQNWAQVRAAGLAYAIPTWTYIQSVAYTGRAVPTRTDLLWQINISLAFGCRGIQYFTYWTPDPARGEGYRGALLTADGRRTPLYAAARDINRHYLPALGRALLPLSSRSVQVANLADPPAGLEPFRADRELRSVGGDPVVLGRFTDGVVLVANYSRHEAAGVRLHTGPDVRRVEVFDPERDRWERWSGPVRLWLPAGHARLLRLRA